MKDLLFPICINLHNVQNISDLNTKDSRPGINWHLYDLILQFLFGQFSRRSRHSQAVELCATESETQPSGHGSGELRPGQVADVSRWRRHEQWVESIFVISYVTLADLNIISLRLMYSVLNAMYNVILMGYNLK